MPSYFNVTTTTNSVRLNNRRTGEAVFSVYNSAGRNLRGRLRIVPLQPAARDWLSHAGDALRDFSIAETIQVTVHVDVPADAAPGPFTFRLDVIGQENPDEDFTEGPVVTFVVPDPHAGEKKPFPWWIVAVAAAILVVGVIVAVFALGGGGVTVPDVSGESMTSAAGQLEDAGLVVADDTEEENSDTVDAGTVIRTDPAAGDSVDEGSTVTLVVSLGPVSIAELVFDELPSSSAELPSPCSSLTLQSLDSLNQDFPAEAGLTSNPFITSDETILQALGEEFGIPQSQLVSIFGAVYAPEPDSRDQVGVLGFDLTSAAAAGRFGGAIQQEVGSEGAVFISDTAIVALWRESSENDRCLGAMQQLVAGVLGTDPLPDPTPTPGAVRATPPVAEELPQ